MNLFWRELEVKLGMPQQEPRQVSDVFCTFNRETHDAVYKQPCCSPSQKFNTTDWNQPGLDANPVGITVHSQFPDGVHTAVIGMESSCIEH